MLKWRLRGIMQLVQGHRRTELGFRSGSVRLRSPCTLTLFSWPCFHTLPHPHIAQPLPEGADLAVCCLRRSAGHCTCPRLCPPASQASTCIRRPEGNWTSASAFKWSHICIMSSTCTKRQAKNVSDLLKTGQLGQVSSWLHDVNAIILIQDQIYSPLNML